MDICYFMNPLKTWHVQQWVPGRSLGGGAWGWGLRVSSCALPCTYTTLSLLEWAGWVRASPTLVSWVTDFIRSDPLIENWALGFQKYMVPCAISLLGEAWWRSIDCREYVWFSSSYQYGTRTIETVALKCITRWAAFDIWCCYCKCLSVSPVRKP